MSDKSEIYAVQMIEYNPQHGHKRKGYVVSGVMSFTAGNAVPHTPFVPSQIVPLKDPKQLIKLGDREVELFEFLTGKDPDEPDKYFVHQPGKPSLPVFRRIVAPSMEQLRGAVDRQAQQSAQMGKPVPPAPILGVKSSMQKVKATAPKTVEQILSEARENASASENDPAETKPDAPPADVPDFMDIMSKVDSKAMTSKNGRTELEKIKDKLEADDLTYIAENGPKILKEWAEKVMDERVAEGK